jgi:hypothetical protein
LKTISIDLGMAESEEALATFLGWEEDQWIGFRGKKGDSQDCIPQFVLTDVTTSIQDPILMRHEPSPSGKQPQ